MPIARIFTNIHDKEDRRLLAKASADVFRSLDVRPEHITTLFIPMLGSDLFVADRTFEEAYGDENFVLVSVAMGSKRGPEVRARLAEAYADAVAGIVAKHNVAIDFTIRDTGDVFVGGVALGRATADIGRLTRAGGVQSTDLDGRLRRLLARHWAMSGTDWAPSTPLAALRGEEAEWDSLEVAALAVVIETNLDLERDLDTGEEEIRTAFGDEATYRDLLTLVETCVR